MVMGLLSLTFSKHPRWLNWAVSCKKTISEITEVDDVDDGKAVNTLYQNGQASENSGGSPLITRASIKAEGWVFIATEEVNNTNTENDSCKIKTKFNATELMIEAKIVSYDEASSCEWTLNNSNIVELKCKGAFLKKLFSRMLIGLGCVGFVLSPIMIAGTLMDLSSDGWAYIYYINKNETKIIQVRII